MNAELNFDEIDVDILMMGCDTYNQSNKTASNYHLSISTCKPAVYFPQRQERTLSILISVANLKTVIFQSVHA